MIVVEVLEHGPEVGRTPAGQALSAFSQLMVDIEGPPVPRLELVFVVGGSLGEPESSTEGVMLASERKSQLRLGISIPSADAHVLATLSGIVELVRRTLRASESTAPWFPYEVFDETLARVETEHGPRTPFTYQPEPEEWEMELEAAKRDLGLN